MTAKKYTYQLVDKNTGKIFEHRNLTEVEANNRNSGYWRANMPERYVKVEEQKMNTKSAEVMGRQAYLDGKKRVPAADARIMEALPQESDPETTKNLLKAWLHGWDKANVQATIDAALRTIDADQGLEEYAQEKVNMVAQELIRTYPEIAENDPKQIGKMARDITIAMLKIAADMATE